MSLHYASCQNSTNKMAKSVPRFDLPKKALDALGALAEEGPARVDALAQQVQKTRPSARPSRLGDILRHWARETGMDERLVDDAVFCVFIPGNCVRERNDLALDEFLEAFSASVQRASDDDWKERHGKKWAEVFESLRPFFAPNNFFAVIHKTTELAYKDHPALFQEAKILTELRPVYDEAADRIHSLLLTNTLILNYYQDDSWHSLHLTMDAEDLEQMARTVERAQKKNRITRQHVGEWNIDLIALARDEE